MCSLRPRTDDRTCLLKLEWWTVFIVHVCSSVRGLRYIPKTLLKVSIILPAATTGCGSVPHPYCLDSETPPAKFKFKMLLLSLYDSVSYYSLWDFFFFLCWDPHWGICRSLSWPLLSIVASPTRINVVFALNLQYQYSGGAAAQILFYEVSGSHF